MMATMRDASARLMVLEKAPAKAGQIWRQQFARGGIRPEDHPLDYLRVAEVRENGMVVWSNGTSTTPIELQESPDWERVSGVAAERLVKQ